MIECKIKKFAELTNNELYEILRIRNQVFIVEQECAFQDIDEYDQKAYHFFINDNEHVIAYLRVLPKGMTFNEVSIGRILVSENNRKRGLAKLILEIAIKFIINELNEDVIKISAQTYLIRFYESLGFKTISEVYLEDGLEHIDMLYQK